MEKCIGESDDVYNQLRGEADSYILYSSKRDQSLRDSRVNCPGIAQQSVRRVELNLTSREFQVET